MYNCLRPILTYTTEAWTLTEKDNVARYVKR